MAQRVEQGPWLVQLWVQLGPAGVDGQRCHHRSPSIVAVDGCKRLRAKRLLLAHLGVEIACCNDQGCGVFAADVFNLLLQETVPCYEINGLQLLAGLMRDVTRENVDIMWCDPKV